MIRGKKRTVDPAAAAIKKRSSEKCPSSSMICTDIHIVTEHWCHISKATPQLDKPLHEKLLNGLNMFFF